MRKKIEFFEKLFKKLNCRNEILQFLRDEHIITDDQMQHILHDTPLTHPTQYASLLDELLTTEKLQLVNYDWTVLPKEFLRLEIVTPGAKKDWTFSI